MVSKVFLGKFIAIIYFTTILNTPSANAQSCLNPYCQAGYTYYKESNFCYKYVSTPTTYSDASQYCVNDCGALAAIHFNSENNFLDSFIKQQATNPTTSLKTWIGYYSFGNTSSTSSWGWTDTSAVTYTDWYQNLSPASGCAPNVAPFATNSSCVNFQTSGWTCDGGQSYWENAYPCNAYLPFVCKQVPICSSSVTTSNSTAVTTPSVPTSVKTCSYPTCKAGYSYYAASNFCYKYVSTPMNYSEASQYCINDCGALAAIHFDNENNFLDSFIKQQATNQITSLKTWIGYYSFGNTSSTSSWGWTDTSAVTYTDWYQNSPPASGCSPSVAPYATNSSCGNFQTSGWICDGGQSYWENAYQCRTYLPFVCKQFPIYSANITATTPSVTTSVSTCSYPTCKAGYSYYAASNFCYKYVSTPMNYSKASQYCINDCGALAAIHFDSENNFLDSFIKQGATNQITSLKTWIGYYSTGNTSSTSSWGWTDTSAVTYTDWYQNSPPASGCSPSVAPYATNSSCGNFQTSGWICNGGQSYWENAYQCSTNLPFVCKQFPI